MQRNLIVYPLAALAALSLLAGLGACSKSGTQPSTATHNASAQTYTLTGQLSYRERIALPPESEARVAVNAVSAKGSAPVAQTTITPEGQVPIAFTLTVPAERIQADQAYQLHGAILDQSGNTLWRIEKPVSFDPEQPKQDLGTLWLVMTPPAHETTASAAYKARGNEPGWLLTMTSDSMTLNWNYGENTLSLPKPTPQNLSNGVMYQTSADNHNLKVDAPSHPLSRRHDGHALPDTVTVVIDGTTLKGCGGEPATLLTGSEWTVKSIDGNPTLDKATPTLTFGADGRVSGSTGCNNFNGGYQLSGEGLSFGQMAVTLKACGADIGQQEHAFLNALNNTRRFDINADGGLVLYTDNGQALVAVHKSQ